MIPHHPIIYLFRAFDIVAGTYRSYSSSLFNDLGHLSSRNFLLRSMLSGYLVCSVHKNPLKTKTGSLSGSDMKLSTSIAN
jgi:hypothetical protein